MKLFRRKNGEIPKTEESHSAFGKNKIEEEIRTLNNNVLHLNYIAGSTNNAVNAIHGSMNEISAGNGDLSDHIHEMKNISENMGRDIEENITHMGELSQSAEVMIENNTKVLNIFGELMEKNQLTSEGIAEVSDNTKLANDAVEKILEATALINEIANKTNLLSLNASIEAARAGDAGRGFAVVAHEIQELAAKSRETADCIGQITRELGERSDKSVESIEKIQETFRQQTENMEDTKLLLNETAENITCVAEHVQLVEQNMDQLEQSKNVISENMKELEKLGENNCKATEMIASDFEKVVTNTRNIKKMAFELSNIEEGLKYKTRQKSKTAENAEQKEKVKIKIGYMQNYGSLCSVIPAMQLGYLEHEGLEAELYKFDNGAQIVEALEAGKIEAGYIGNGGHLRCIQGDAKVFLLSHISNAEAIIGNRKKGVWNLKMLAGKKIGTVEGSACDTLLSIALSSLELTRADCTIVSGKPEEIIQKMETGELDACTLWSPYTMEVQKKLGTDAVQLANNMTFINRLTSLSSFASLSSWATSVSYAQEHKDTLIRLTRALYRGMNFRAIDENSRQTAAWVASKIHADEKNLYEQRLDAEWLTEGFVAVGAQNGTLKQLYEAQQSDFLKNGSITHSVPVEQYVMFDNMIEAAK